MKPSLRFVSLAASLLLAAGAHAQQAKPAAKKGASAPAAAAAASAPQAVPAGVKQDTEKENAGKTAASAWLGLLDRRDWGTAWEHSSALFRKNVPLPAWMDGVPKVREPLGALQERQILAAVYRTTLPGHPDGEYVTVTFASKFEKKPETQEVVTTVREADGRWRITGYAPPQ